MRQSALGAESSPEECLGGCDVPLHLMSSAL
jgi:hypothetical protein